MSKIVIVLEGGLVQNIVAEEPVEVLVIDYDAEGADEDEITAVPQDNGGTADAVLSLREVEVNPTEVAELFALGSEQEG
ncbi:hypothetical protein D3C76_1014120 [compost metagenome]